MEHMEGMSLKKLINSPENYVDETLEGLVLAYGDRLRFAETNKRVILRATTAKKGKVGIVTAGGFGHLPVFLGYVGENMLDGCAVGNVFASPSARSMSEMIEACDNGAGVLCVFGNYGGDKMNLSIAREAAELEGIRTETVLVCDDVASSPPESAEKRRGVAGMVYAFKIAGAAAAQMRGLDEVKAVTARALENIRTFGVALSPCIVPQVGKPTFSINEDEMELGMGIHGEPGIQVCKMLSADETADTVLSRLLEDMPLAAGEEVSVMINGLGATPLEEQLIFYRRVHNVLSGMGVKIIMPHIGEYATSMEMAGLSLTVFRLDEDTKALLRYPGDTPFYTNHNI